MDGLRPPFHPYRILLLHVYCIICKLLTDKAIYFLMYALCIVIKEYYNNAKKVYIVIYKCLFKVS